jgi:uncharacterized membrane protein
VPISLTVLLVLAGVVLLAFGIGSTRGAIRFLSGGVALLIAIAASAATIGLFWLGQKNNWTSDGPGALFVMIAVVVCAIVAAVGWISSSASRPAPPRRSTRFPTRGGTLVDWESPFEARGSAPDDPRARRRD